MIIRIFATQILSKEKIFLHQLTCPTEETPLSVLPHLEYCDSFLSPTNSLVFSKALKISDCKKNLITYDLTKKKKFDNIKKFMW